jgi:hypothetical protein
MYVYICTHIVIKDIIIIIGKVYYINILHYRTLLVDFQLNTDINRLFTHNIMYTIYNNNKNKKGHFSLVF